MATEEAKGDKASNQKYEHNQGAITSERHSCETDKPLKKAMSDRHLPVGDGHFVCQELGDVPSVGFEEIFAIMPSLQKRLTDFTFDVKSVRGGSTAGRLEIADKVWCGDEKKVLHQDFAYRLEDFFSAQVVGLFQGSAGRGGGVGQGESFHRLFKGMKR